MRKRLIVLLWLGLYVLCLWLAVRAAAEAQQISPGASLRYVQALRSDQVMKARAYAQSEQNEGGIFATFWTENESSVQAAASQRTIQEVCSIGFYGAASAAYAANYLYGTAPGDGDTSQCSVSISLAWDLWGSTDVLGQILTLDPDTENADTEMKRKAIQQAANKLNDTIPDALWNTDDEEMMLKLRGKQQYK